MYAKKPEYLHCPPNTLELNYKYRVDYCCDKQTYCITVAQPQAKILKYQDVIILNSSFVPALQMFFYFSGKKTFFLCFPM